MNAGPGGRPETPPEWQLPDGVNRSLWAYAHDERLAETEDEYFFNHPLFEADARLLAERFTAPGRLIDLGAGAGRLSLPYAGRGFRVVSVELSHALLKKLGENARRRGLPVGRVEANLCRLGCFPDRTFDYALSMFSTLGMIRGARARRRAVEESFRILKPGGRLALHAHNLWLNLRDPQGRRWLLGQLPRIMSRREGAGDRAMTYRGIPNMEVHLYRWGELRRDLVGAGFRLDEVIPIHEVTAKTIRVPWLLPTIRAGGWLIFASRPLGS